jgi:hypothetical protein
MLIAAPFCIARAIADIRQRRYVWGLVGILVGIALASSLIVSTSIKVDLPTLPPATR